MGGRAEGNEEKWKGAIPFLEASWGLPCIHGRGCGGQQSIFAQLSLSSAVPLGRLPGNGSLALNFWNVAQKQISSYLIVLHLSSYDHS